MRKKCVALHSGRPRIYPWLATRRRFAGYASRGTGLDGLVATLSIGPGPPGLCVVYCNLSNSEE